jgi:hypothetical protein
MAILCDGVKPAYRTRLQRGLDTVRERVRERRQRIPAGLQTRLRAFLESPHPQVRLFVDGGERGFWACSTGYCMWIRPRCFTPWAVTGSSRLPAVLFHELVHVAGGSELDAEALENALFTPKEGAVAPTAADWADFAARDYRGEWLSLNRRTGIVRDARRRVVCRFPRDAAPPRAEEGLMAEPKKVAKQEKLGVRITVEFTGHLKKADLDMFTKSLGSVLHVHMENGGNGN